MAQIIPSMLGKKKIVVELVEEEEGLSESKGSNDMSAFETWHSKKAKKMRGETNHSSKKSLKGKTISYPHQPPKSDMESSMFFM
eukprot:13752448-Ditylum_brightwellii.AAC.1